MGAFSSLEVKKLPNLSENSHLLFDNAAVTMALWHLLKVVPVLDISGTKRWPGMKQ